MAKAPNIFDIIAVDFFGCAKIKEFSGGARVQCDTSIYQGYAITLGRSIEVACDIISFNQVGQCIFSYLDNRPQSIVSIVDEVDG